MVKRYKRIIYTFKNSIEVYEYLDGKYGAPGKKRGKKRKLTEEAIRYRNQWNRERKVRHKLKTWFKKNDYMVLLTYKKNERPPDMDTAKKDLSKAMRRVREKYKKAGQTMRWMANIEVGTKGAWHVHIVINRIADADVPFGYIGVLWFEELDQFMGPEAVRKIEQSVIRGGDTAYIFKTFNPPKSLNNWANKYIKIPKETRLVTESTYLDIPKKWLGKTFIEEAEFLKETNPDAYENEYLGVANGSGGSVFDNITIREITDDEISGFDHVLNGIDWGWFPDPYAFARVHYDRARLRLYVWQEYTCNKRSNRQTADELIRMGITGNDLLTCDSAEKKSIGDYKSYGLLARAAEKGPGSREYSYKWLQSLREIIIDNVRCPVAAQEFMDYEYERDKEGNIITGYPDGNDHMIDAVRYATERIWKRRGE